MAKSFGSEILLISATYYNESTLYEKNSVALLFNGIQNLSSQIQLWCISNNLNGSIIKISPLQLTKSVFQMRECKMRAYSANCLTVPNLHSFGICAGEACETENQVPIPLRNAVYDSLPVVSCVSPLFFNERWQINLLSIETYAFFGVSKQVYYYMSVIEDGFNLLKEYEKLGIIDLNPWIIPTISDIRTQLEFRNQVTAHNDCYLRYREAADFIIVHDPDDILILQNLTSYWKSFASFAFANPFIGNILFERYNSYMTFGSTLKRSLRVNPLSNLKISKRSVWRKSVYLTRGVEAINNHDASYFQPNYSSEFFDSEKGFFIHARNVSFDNDQNGFLNSTFTGERHKELAAILGLKQLNNLKESYNQRLKYFHYQKFLQNLKSTNFYYSLIDECYEYVYYHDEHNITNRKSCPSHYHCKIPEMPGVKCIHSKFEIKSLTANSITFFYLTNPSHVISSKGCYAN